jgi:transcriptional regulator with XRE-family HTH domain
VASSPLGSSLRSAREHAGWSRETLAHRSGLSCAAIAQIESGRRRDVRLASLVALAGALGVSVDRLAGGTATVGSKLLEHRVLIYDSDAEYLASTLPFLLEGIARDDCLLVVTNDRQIRLLRDALGDDAVRVELHDSAEWYRSPTGALRSYRSFVKERVESGARWIRIIGEPVWAGRSQAEVAEWTRYESILNLVLASWPVTLICPYDARSSSESILEGARHTHPEVARANDVSVSAAYREPEDFLLALP